MGHPFKVGEMFRNRDGDYEVVALDGPKMAIRYLDGRRLETTIKLQKRIWENIQAEERLRAYRRQSARGPGYRGRKSTALGDIVRQHLDDLFVAYSFPYLEEAIDAIEVASDDVEAVVVQPYCKSRIVSARQAMEHYRVLTGGRHIPILFTPQTRHQEQVFEYGSCLFDLCHKSESDRVRKNVASGKWLLWDESLYATNFLIIETPIKELPVKPPIGMAINVLSGSTQGEAVGAVAIPAPKALDPDLRHLLADL